MNNTTASAFPSGGMSHMTPCIPQSNRIAWRGGHRDPVKKRQVHQAFLPPARIEHRDGAPMVRAPCSPTADTGAPELPISLRQGRPRSARPGPSAWPDPGVVSWVHAEVTQAQLCRETEVTGDPGANRGWSNTRRNRWAAGHSDALAEAILQPHSAHCSADADS